MAWVRIDDTVPHHHKVLKAGPSAAWLWVCGIAYCQRHLTDGFIPEDAVGMLGVLGVTRAKKLANVLVSVGLLEKTDGGFRVHDYHKHNLSAEEAREKRERLSSLRAEIGRKGGSRASKRQANAKQTSEANSKQTVANAGSKTQAPSHPIPLDDVKNTSSSATPSKSGRSYGRLFLLPWQQMQISDALGPHFEQFGLDEWLDALSAQADRQSLTFPSKEERWSWVMSELKQEIIRRRLPMATATAAPSRPEPKSTVPGVLETRRRYLSEEDHA